MANYTAYRSAELAALYDAVYANSTDIAFWQVMATAGSDGLLELGCGTGRVLLPLARAGHTITGLDLAASMLEHSRANLQAESPEVRDRVTLLEADMTSFDLDRRFAQIYCAFGTFHHLRTVEQQLACLERCRQHLLPQGSLILDLINPDPAPASVTDDAPAAGETAANIVDWTEGRRIRSWATMLDYQRSLQCNDCEVTYEIIEADGATRRLTETFPMRLVYRYELEHLLARCGFRIVALYGDYDRSAFSDESLGLIVVAELTGETQPSYADAHSL
jgi:SAM-dependent methyltransferase